MVWRIAHCVVDAPHQMLIRMTLIRRPEWHQRILVEPKEQYRHET